jgi:hypothetical protein
MQKNFFKNSESTKNEYEKMGNDDFDELVSKLGFFRMGEVLI